MLNNPSEIGARSLSLAKRPLGRILVDGRFITDAELERAVGMQRTTGEPLGEILIALGAVTRGDLDAVLAAQMSFSKPETAARAAAGGRRFIGELLVQAARVTEGQLSEALAEQAATGRRLGEIFVAKGHISAVELESILRFQSNQGDEASVEAGFRLGELLLNSRHITYEQLKHALALQQSTGRRLGEVLVEAGYAGDHHVRHGLALQKRLVTAALVAVLSFAAVSEAAEAPERPVLRKGASGAPGASSLITVSADVMAKVSVSILMQRPELVITNADIARGYVDVAAASLIEIQNNNPAGYLMVFEGADPNFKEVHVTGLGSQVVLNPGSNWLARPFAGKAPVRVELSTCPAIPRPAPTIGRWPSRRYRYDRRGPHAPSQAAPSLGRAPFRRFSGPGRFHGR